jgi:FG-GAP-like repeat/FG-GAP repeat
MSVLNSRSFLAVSMFGSLAFAGEPDRASTPATSPPTATPRFVGAAETSFRDEGDAITTAHRAGNLRARFDAAGVLLVDLAGRHEPLRSSFRGIGRGEVLAAASNQAPKVGPEGTITYKHGTVVEWWKHDARGLEQGFTVHRKPQGDGDLQLSLALASAHALRIARDGRAFDLVTVEASTGRETAVFRFENLIAFDRDGDDLKARFAAVEGGVAIVVDDQNADYPITIDPVASSPAFDLEGNFADAQFGVSVASAGDVNGDGFSDLLVGASNFSGGLAFEGKAYLYVGTANGLSTSPAWEATGGQANAYFGRVVASAGDVNDDGFSDVLVAAQLFDDDQVDEGRVFVYLGSGSGLSVSPAIVIDGNEVGGQFGQAIAGAGDVNGDGYSDVALGSQFYDFGGFSNSGLVAVFHGGASGITATRDSIFGGNQIDARLGAAIASVGDVNADGFADLAYSATLFDDTKTDEGKVFAHHGGSSGLASSPAFSVVGNQNSAQMGNSLSCAGDVNGDGYSDLVVGAQLFDFGEPDEGRAFLYAGSASGLATTPAWTTESDQTNARHGNAVATAGDIDGDGYSDVAVSALLFDDTLTDQGRVSIYHGSATGLSTTAQSLVGPQSSGIFGQSLAFAGDVNGDGLSDLASGAQAFANGQAGEGRVVVHHGELALPPVAFQWAAKGGQIGADFARAATFAGDLNGDGFDDVAFGAPEFDQTTNTRGKLTVHYGAGTGLTSTTGFEAVGEIAGDRLGSAVARIGDLDGDGYDDLAVGVPGVDGDVPGIGEVIIHYGSATGVSADATAAVRGDEPSVGFGESVAGVGDVDVDGFVDIAIASPTESATFTFGGVVRLYRGGANGPSADAFWETDGASASEFLGLALAPLGDVDGDGFADFALGAPGAGNGNGRVDVYLGGSSGPGTTPDLSIDGSVVGESFGTAIDGAGDVNADGFSDAIFGAENAARIHHGSGSGLAASATTSLTSQTALGLFGTAVARAGDLDRDGFGDVIVAAPEQFVDQVAEGAIYVFLGTSGGISSTIAWTVEGDQVSSEFGATLSGGGDVDGDGTGDLLVGAPAAENGFTDEGRGFLYYGNGDGGSALGPRLRTLRSDQTAPVAHGGNSFATTFRVDGLARSPFGRATVVPQVEVKALGVPFDGTGLLTTTALDTGLSGTTQNIVSSTLSDGVYRYRARGAFETRMIPFQPTTPWRVRARDGANEGDLVVRSTASILVVDPIGEFDIAHLIGAADPDAGSVVVRNLGSGSLGFTVSESPDVGWLALSPTGGSGIVAAGVGTTVTFNYSAGALTPGVYATDVMIANSALPSESVTIPVTLTVTNPRFTPGDRLESVLDTDDDILDADFDAVTGETLKLRFDAVSTAFKIKVQVLDSLGAVVSNETVKLLTSGIVKHNVKLSKSDTFTLRLRSLTGTAGAAIGVATSAKLPALAKQFETDLTIKATKSKSLKFLAIDGAVLQFTLRGDVDGPLTITCDTPEGNSLSFTESIQDPNDGTLKVIGILLEETGEYILRVGNDGGSKIELEVDLEVDQPVGDGTVTLP